MQGSDTIDSHRICLKSTLKCPSSHWMKWPLIGKKKLLSAVWLKPSSVCMSLSVPLVQWAWWPEVQNWLQILKSEEHPYLFFFCNAILLFLIVLSQLLTYLIQVLLYFSAQKMLCCFSWCGIFFHICYHCILTVSLCLFLLHTFTAFNADKWFPYIFN